MNQAETCSVLILAKLAAECVFPPKCSCRLARLKSEGELIQRQGVVFSPHPTLLGPPSIPAC